MGTRLTDAGLANLLAAFRAAEEHLVLEELVAARKVVDAVRSPDATGSDVLEAVRQYDALFAGSGTRSIPTLEEELEQITSDAAAVIDWAEHVRLQVRKAIDKIKARVGDTVWADREAGRAGYLADTPTHGSVGVVDVVERAADVERENAALLCDALAAEHFAQQGGGPLAAVAIEAATRIRAGQRARTFQTTGGESGR